MGGRLQPSLYWDPLCFRLFFSQIRARSVLEFRANLEVGWVGSAPAANLPGIDTNSQTGAQRCPRPIPDTITIWGQRKKCSSPAWRRQTCYMH
eukprot:COSAG02_NODE_179_length_31090_cov_49.813785_18_plen_93_part_00